MKIIDSHTIGEPTRIIIEGGPDLGDGPLEERAKVFREQYDHIRKAGTTIRTKFGTIGELPTASCTMSFLGHSSCSGGD